MWRNELPDKTRLCPGGPRSSERPLPPGWLRAPVGKERDIPCSCEGQGHAHGPPGKVAGWQKSLAKAAEGFVPSLPRGVTLSVHLSTSSASTPGRSGLQGVLCWDPLIFQVWQHCGGSSAHLVPVKLCLPASSPEPPRAGARAVP